MTYLLIFIAYFVLTSVLHKLVNKTELNDDFNFYMFDGVFDDELAKPPPHITALNNNTIAFADSNDLRIYTYINGEWRKCAMITTYL